MPTCWNRVCMPMRRDSESRSTAVQILGLQPMRGAADSGEDRCDDVVAQGVIGHPPTVGGCGILRQPDCPEGATPSGRSPGRSVATL
jgi:hypothetical protein